MPGFAAIGGTHHPGLEGCRQGKAYDAPPLASGAPSPGATIFVPLTLAPGASRTIPLRLSWYAGIIDAVGG